jgi:hypothetical protein
MIYTQGQYIGLLLTQELNDYKHKGFYLKLAKDYDADDIFFILSLTKDIIKTSKKPIKNKAALFTRLFFDYIDKKNIKKL